MTKNSIPMRPIEEIYTDLFVLKKLAEECEERGHHIEGGVIGGYRPGSDVTVECRHCKTLYERPATGEEISSYSKALKFEFTI